MPTTTEHLYESEGTTPTPVLLKARENAKTSTPAKPEWDGLLPTWLTVAILAGLIVVMANLGYFEVHF